MVFKFQLRSITRGPKTTNSRLTRRQASAKPSRKLNIEFLEGRIVPTIIYVPIDYATIQGAINAASNGDTIQVAAGTYAESITIDKSLTLVGAQANQSATTRFAAFTSGANGPKANPGIETVITAPTVAPNDATNDLVHVAASDVTINGFVLDGNNPALNQANAIVVAGINTDSRRGVETESATGSLLALDHLLIENNVVQNVSQVGVEMSHPDSSSQATSANLIVGNLVSVFGSTGISLASNVYSDITSNMVLAPANSDAGILLAGFTNNGASSITMSISQNQVTIGKQAQAGIWFNGMNVSAVVLNVSDNTVNAATGVNAFYARNYGIYISSLQGGIAATLSNNNIGSSGGQLTCGIDLWNLPTTTPVSIVGGTIANCFSAGIDLDNIDPRYGAASADTTVNVSGITVTGGTDSFIARAEALPSQPSSGSNIPSANVRLNVSGVSLLSAATGILVRAPANAGNHTAYAQVSGGTLMTAKSGVPPAGVQAWGANAAVRLTEGSLYGFFAGVWIDHSTGANYVGGLHIAFGNIGIYCNAAATATIESNTIYSNATGISVLDGNLTIQHNSVNSNSGAISIVEDTGPLAGNTVVHDNDLSNNATFISFSATSAVPIADCSGNWFGSAVLGDISSGIKSSLGDEVDFTPYLNQGTDTSLVSGFQGDFSSLTVHSAGAQIGSVGRIQEGINLLADGSLTGNGRLLNVLTGTYAESVSADKRLTLAPGGFGNVSKVSINGNLSFATDGSILQMDVNAPYVTAGTDFDQLIVNGNVDLTGTLLALSGSGGDNAASQRLTLISSAGATTAASIPTEGAIYSPGSNHFVISYRGGNNQSDVVLLLLPKITWASPSAIIYGTALSATQLDASADAVGGGAFAYAPSVGTVLHAGANQVLSTTFTPTDSLNYATTTLSTLLTVNQASLTVTADDKSKIYGGADPVLTYTVGGLVNGDTTAALSGVVVTTTTGSAATAGDHAITPTSGVAADYSVINVNGTLHVDKAAALTVTADDKSKIYGAAEPVLTYTVSGTTYYGDAAQSVVSGVLLSTATGALATAGDHAITATGGTSANYADAIDVNGTLHVAKAAALTVTADDKSKIYGDADPVLSYTVSGTTYYGDVAQAVVSGVELSTVTGPAATPGVHPIIAAGGTSTNYADPVDVNGTLLVNQAPGFTSAAAITFAAGVGGTFTVTCAGFPAPTLSETGTLPDGVNFNASTGVLSGTPLAGTKGTYHFVFAAHNGVGTDALQNFTLTVTQNGAINGLVYRDYDLSGELAANDSKLAGRTVFLDLNNNGILDAGEPSSFTDASGAYSFTSLAAGNFVVRQVLWGGDLLSAPPSGSFTLNLGPDSNFSNQNFGDVIPSSIVPLALPPQTGFPPQGNANADFVEAIYRAVLNRNADTGGLASWTGVLASGQATRLQAAQGITTSPERFGLEVNAFYQTLLGRSADAQGKTHWVQQMENGVREEQVAAAFLGSAENLNKGDKHFVEGLYESVLGRIGDPVGEAGWLDALGDNAAGNPTHTPTLTHVQVINDFLFSSESLDRLVTGYYQTFLQRQADPGGLNAWANELHSGAPFLSVGQEFLASDEFYSIAAANG